MMGSSGWSVKTKKDEGRMEGRGATICHIHCPPNKKKGSPTKDQFRKSLAPHCSYN